MKKLIIIIIIALLLVGTGGYFLIKYLNDSKEIVLTDAQKFSEEYTLVNEDNVFIYKDAKEIINILKNGTGVVYIGFPECPWCQEYVIYLNEVAKDVGVDKIYYYNILNDRKDNNKDYKEIVSLLKDYLFFDDEGNSRVFVPDVTVVKDGKIIGHDNETSNDTLGFEEPKEYWSTERLNDLKTRLKTMMEEVKNNSCTDCNA